MKQQCLIPKKSCGRPALNTLVLKASQPGMISMMMCACNGFIRMVDLNAWTCFGHNMCADEGSIKFALTTQVTSVSKAKTANGKEDAQKTSSVIINRKQNTLVVEKESWQLT
eukprot:2081056-Amphidinium_carterae.1